MTDVKTDITEMQNVQTEQLDDRIEKLIAEVGDVALKCSGETRVHLFKAAARLARAAMVSSTEQPKADFESDSSVPEQPDLHVVEIVEEAEVEPTDDTDVEPVQTHTPEPEVTFEPEVTVTSEFDIRAERALKLLGDKKLTDNESQMLAKLIQNYGQPLAPRTFRDGLINPPRSKMAAQQMVSKFLKKVRSTELGSCLQSSGATKSKRYWLDFDTDLTVAPDSDVITTVPAEESETVETTKVVNPGVEELAPEAEESTGFSELHSKWGLTFEKQEGRAPLVRLDDKPIYGFKDMSAELLYKLANCEPDTKFNFQEIKAWFVGTSYEEASDEAIKGAMQEIYNRLAGFNKQGHLIFIGRSSHVYSAISIGLRVESESSGRRSEGDFLANRR